MAAPGAVAPAASLAAAVPQTGSAAVPQTGAPPETVPADRLLDPRAEISRQPVAELPQPVAGSVRADAAWAPQSLALQSLASQSTASQLPIPEAVPVDATAARASLAAAVFERRALLEAASRQRGDRDARAGAVEGAERPAVPGGEVTEPRAQTAAPRPVAPVLAGRDLSALAERIEMLVHRRIGAASVNLSLGDRGDVEISVRMDSRHAHVQFVVQDAAVREALESQLPRLRALLAEGGLELGDVDMNLAGRSGSEPDRRPEPAPRQSTVSAAVAAGTGEDAPEIRRLQRGDHLIDAFA